MEAAESGARCSGEHDCSRNPPILTWFRAAVSSATPSGDCVAGGSLVLCSRRHTRRSLVRVPDELRLLVRGWLLQTSNSLDVVAGNRRLVDWIGWTAFP